MQHQEAVQFISTDEIDGARPAMWADLGCGSGVFTFALAELLAGGSTVFAIDKSNTLSARTMGKVIDIQFQNADFEKEDFDLPPLDGILMANSLHYVTNQHAMIRRLRPKLKPGGLFVLVEYDTSSPNQWVPHPVNFEKASELFLAAGFTSIRKIAERSSVYNSSKMYASVIAY